jgi:hypothetical protein
MNPWVPVGLVAYLAGGLCLVPLAKRFPQRALREEQAAYIDFFRPRIDPKTSEDAVSGLNALIDNVLQTGTV